MAEQSRTGEKFGKQKIDVPQLCVETEKQTLSHSPPHAFSSPSSPVGLRKTTSVRQNCLCSPTTHAGSFRCRYHRSAMTRNSISVGSKLNELAGKSNDICEALHPRTLIAGHNQRS